MRVTILGSGTSIPAPGRFPAGVLVESGDLALLVDVGPGTLRRLPEAGVGLEQIGAVLLTHYHTDHTSDLAALLFALRNPRYQGRPPLRVFGAPGLRDLVAHLTKAWPWLDPRGGYPLELQEIGPGRFTVPPLQITAVPIEHTAQSLAYRLEAPSGATAAISGDADVRDGLVDVARGVDLFVCECSFPDELRCDGHLTPRLAGAAAAAADAKLLCLTHFYPECEGVDLAAQTRQAYTGDLVLAADLQRFDLQA
ncbi:MAG: ribonuclease Z [Planctomycetota bacterium]